MLKLAFISFFIFLYIQSSFALEEDINATFLEENTTQTTLKEESIQPKVLYLSYIDIPNRLIEGEIFQITLKTLPVINNVIDINYTFSNENDVELIEPLPQREIHGRYFYDTFYFQATGLNVKTPDITAKVFTDTNDSFRPTILPGKPIETIALPQKKDFCNIIAKEMVIKKYKTTEYDDTHNIILFTAEAQQTFLRNFHLQNIITQGFESLQETLEHSKMTYYVVIDKMQENLVFTYFNLEKNDFIKLAIPIIVEDDKVVTQSDLNPHDQSKQKIKIIIALVISLILIILFLFHRKVIYVLFLLIPGVYIFISLNQQQEICIRKDTKIRILPLENSTVFEVIPNKQYLKKIGSTKNFVKVEFNNKKIGWIKNEDICSY